MEGAAAADKRLEGPDIDKQLADAKSAFEKGLADVEHAQALRKKSPELQDAGNFFKTLADIDDDGAAVAKATRFKRK